jgi:AraC-like DNA-binding protein
MPQLKGMLPDTPLISSKNICEETAAAFRKIVDAKDNLSQIGYIYIALSDLLNSLTLRKLNYNDDENISQRVIEYISLNFKEPITLETLSTEFGVSKSYLSHVFSEQLNIHFRTYLGAVRADYCAALMKTTSKSLTDIAFEGGFESQRSFNRVFKEYFGISPSEYKKGLLH